MRRCETVHRTSRASRREILHRVGIRACVTVEESLRQERCGRCRRVFHVCTRHDNGRVYCGKACSGAARKLSVDAARARHRKSEDGRADHRRHQEDYRARVRDQRGRKVDEEATVCVPTPPSPPPPVSDERHGKDTVDAADEETPLGVVRCTICRRSSRFVRRTFLSRRARAADG